MAKGVTWCFWSDITEIESEGQEVCIVKLLPSRSTQITFMKNDRFKADTFLVAISCVAHSLLLTNF